MCITEINISAIISYYQNKSVSQLHSIQDTVNWYNKLNNTSFTHADFVSILKTAKIQPHVILAYRGLNISEYLVDHYFLGLTSLDDLTKDFGFQNKSNCYRSMRKSPNYRPIKRPPVAKKYSLSVKTDLIRFNWLGDKESRTIYDHLAKAEGYTNRRRMIANALEDFITREKTPSFYPPGRNTSGLYLPSRVYMLLNRYSEVSKCFRGQIFNTVFHLYFSNYLDN